MHKFWYDYVKPNYDANTKMLHGQLRYTDSVNVHVKRSCLQRYCRRC